MSRWLLLFLGGCDPIPDPAVGDTAAATAPQETGAGGDGTDSGGGASDDTAAVVVEPLSCPEDMAMVQDELGEPVYCIDLYETSLDEGGRGERDQGAGYPDGSTLAVALSLRGVEPAVNISWYQAIAVCLNAGKYLCSSAEWEDACDGQVGAGGLPFPWGAEWSDDACVTLTASGTSQYGSMQPTGSLETCVSPVGVYDLVGNAWEWADPLTTGEDGLPVTDKRGGAYYAGQGSSQCPVAFHDHPPEFDGTIAARCCMTPIQR